MNQREIKFRAWSYINKRMYNLVMVGGMPQTVPAWYSGEKGWVDLWLRNEKDGVVMQYTGLKDKNGLEIYEGDIVKGIAEDKGQSEVFYKYGVWQPFSYLDNYNGADFEVIGNIYENPELIHHS